MALHIGIVACSAEGAALCYQTICKEGPAKLGPHKHPEVSMHTPPFSKYVDFLQAGDWQAVGDLMLVSATKLAAIGADFLICPDNTIHNALDMVEDKSPVPWLHIARVVSEEAHRRGMKKLGLMGTRWLVESDTYPRKLSKLGIGCIIPSKESQIELDRIIMEELVYGKFLKPSIKYLQSVISRFSEDTCDAVALVCTELPLVINDNNSNLPILDSTRLLALAALKYAIDTDRAI